MQDRAYVHTEKVHLMLLVSAVSFCVEAHEKADNYPPSSPLPCPGLWTSETRLGQNLVNQGLDNWTYIFF